MSFWDDLVRMGVELVEDPKTVRMMADMVLLRVDAEEHPDAAAALEFVREHADDVAHVAPRGLIGLTGKFWQLGEIAAREAYLRHHASIDEALDAQQAAHEATVQEAQHSTWTDDVLPVIKALAPVLPQVLPFLLAVL